MSFESSSHQSNRMFRMERELRRLRAENKLLLELLGKSKVLLKEYREIATELLAEDAAE